MSVLPKTPDEWLEAIQREFERESDRAAVIIVAAMLDEALRTLLGRRLVPAHKPELCILTASEGPLATFSARINAAFQLGLISHFMARDLHLVRRIRNDVAHNVLERSFETPAVKDRVRALDEASDYNRRYPETRQAFGPPGTRHDFLGATAWMLYSLHSESIVQLAEREPEFGYIDWTKLPADLLEFLRQEVERQRNDPK